MNVSVYVSVYVRMCQRVHICLCMPLCICMYVCMSMCMYVCPCTCVWQCLKPSMAQDKMAITIRHSMSTHAAWLGPIGKDDEGAPVLAAGIVLNIFSHGTRSHGPRADAIAQALICTCRALARASAIIKEGNDCIRHGRPPSHAFVRIHTAWQNVYHTLTVRDTCSGHVLSPIEVLRWPSEEARRLRSLESVITMWIFMTEELLKVDHLYMLRVLFGDEWRKALPAKAYSPYDVPGILCVAKAWYS